MFGVHCDERICSSVLVCDCVRCSSDDGNKTCNGCVEYWWKEIQIGLNMLSHSVKDGTKWVFVHFSTKLY